MPRTRLGGFCDKVIEASWLAALVVVPLLFNVYSSRVFEPDKITALRSIAIAAAGAWLVKFAESGFAVSGGNGGPASVAKAAWRRIVETPLVLPTVALMTVYLLATALSIVPRVSLLGSYQRLQGTYSTLSYVVIFLVMLNGLRRREQVERLITTVVLTSLPIALYGIVQHYGLDPLPWGGDVRTRVAANMGNAIFVAAYLIMALPLALYRVVESFTVILTAEEDRFVDTLLDILLGASYVFIVAVQGIAIFFTQSRGPWLGLIGGLFFFFLVLSAIRRWRWLVWLSVSAVVGIVAFLVAFNIPGSPLEPLKSVPYVGRLGQVLDKEQTTSKVRLLIWEGAIDLILPHAPLERPDGARDWLNPVRTLIGYGPESMYVAYNRFYPPELAHVEARNASPDRSHNETFDALVTTGGVGFAVYMTLFASLFYHGFRWLGVIADRKQRNLFLSCWIGGGFVGATTMVLWQGKEFFGVGLPAGIVAGLGIYLVVWGLFFSRPLEIEAATSTHNPRYSLLIGALVAAILAHFIEIHFGIAIAATRTYFWSYAALMVVTGYLMPQEEADDVELADHEEQAQRGRQRASRRRSRERVGRTRRYGLSGVRAVLSYALVLTLILCTLAYDFVSNNEAKLASAAGIVVASLTKRPENGELVRSYGMLGVVAITWLLGSAVIVAESMRKSGSRTWQSALLTCLAVPFVVFFLFALVMAGRLVNTGRQTQLLDQARLVTGMLSTYYVIGLGVLVSLAAAMPSPAGLAGSPLWRMPQGWAYPFTAAGAFWVVLQSNMQVVQADMIYKQAQPYEQQSMWDYSIVLHQEAIKHMPNEDYYHLFLGRAFLEKAKDAQATSGSPRTFTMSDILDLTPEQLAGLSREDAMNCSDAALHRAREVNPLNTDHSANLGRLYRTRAELATDPVQRYEYFQDSLEYYTQATSLSPNAAHLYDEWGLVYLAMGKPELARAKYEYALALDDRYEVTYMSLGDLYLREDDLERAKKAYLKAVELAPRSANVRAVLAYIYGVQGEYGPAIEETLQVLKLANDQQQQYTSYKNLAIYYRELGQAEEAIQAAQEALARAPATDRATLEALILQLGGTPASVQPEAQLQQYLSAGQTALSSGQWQAAEQAYQRALEIDPDSIAAHSGLSYVYAQQGKLQQAETENLIVLRAVPDDLATLKNLAIIYRQLGQYEDALEYAERAMRSPGAKVGDKQQLEAFIEELRALRSSG